MEVEPIMRPSTPEDTWLDSSTEKPLRRRRVGRKRKRRPESPSAEALVAHERFSYPEEPVRPIFEADLDEDESKSSNTPKRRKKKQEPRPGRWDSPIEEDRPLRRRGQRRKRPALETWPEFSEFNDYRPNETPREINEHLSVGQTQANSDDDYRHYADREPEETLFKQPAKFEETIDHEPEINIESSQDEHSISIDANEQYENPKQSEKIDNALNKPIPQDDKSLSEFTVEDVNHGDQTNIEEERLNMREKIKEKSLGYFKEAEKAQGRGPIDPLTLKDILKKSNGTSLSEILQQHNLSLADLLHGKKQVLSILKPEDTPDNPTSTPAPTKSITSTESKITYSSKRKQKESSDDRFLLNSETKYVRDHITEAPVTLKVEKYIEDATEDEDVDITTTERSKLEETSRRPNIRRFPTSIRRKQRIRPVINNTYKSQLSRDMLALNAKKYFNNRRRNSTQWRDLLPMTKKNISNVSNEKPDIEITTVTIENDETTTLQDSDNCTKVDEQDNVQNNVNENLDDIEVITERQTETKTENDDKIVPSAIPKTDKPAIIKTEKPSTTPTPALNASGLRRQAFNNRLKRKRLKQKNLTTEPPQDDIMLNLFGIPNLVSSSEFIAQTQKPKTSIDDVSMLEDFLTTESTRRHENRTKSRFSPSRAASTPQFVFIPSSTEESAKIEIEEILNDSQTSARLSKILMERNMTVSELVEHRERGSSHVHLADIFHNASKEPNPPEPFLSKSVIEPISKETYPLRALLDANIHDTTAKATTMDSMTAASTTTEVNIPVVMNFGNNVNKNAENMGIMSLFHNITKNHTDIDKEKTNLMKDSQGTFYETTITVVNTTDVPNGTETFRESRVIHVLNDNQDDVVSWNDIFTLMRKNYENSTDEATSPFAKGLIPAEKIKKPSLDDADGDGIIVLEDLQNLKDFDSNIASASNEKIDFNTYESGDISTRPPAIFDKLPNQTSSVTVATASIAGLAMILCLLTYVAYRWQQHRNTTVKTSFADDRVPTPVFENRKGHKHNSSTRSISPMLSSSNIYTLNTLDSRNGKESPDYMWDSLRKPFQ